MKPKSIIIILMTVILTVLFTSSIFAVPPHPDLVERFREEGRIDELIQKMNETETFTRNASIMGIAPSEGSNEVLVLMIEFADFSFDDESDKQFYSDLFNGVEDDDKSWRKYYIDMSKNELRLTFDVEGIYTSEENKSYYSSFYNVPELIVEALDAADDDGVDFGRYDNDHDGYLDGVVVIHSGRGYETSGSSSDIHSHRGYIYPPVEYDNIQISDYSIQPEYMYSPQDSTIGVFVHEYGHLLGLPDLYDTQYSTDGVGYWSLMAAGSWSGGGASPSPLLAWEREYLGWLKVERASSSHKTSHITDKSNTTMVVLSISAFMVMLIGVVINGVKKKKLGHIGVTFLILAFALPGILMFNTCKPKEPVVIGDGDFTTVEDLEVENIATKIELSDTEYYLIENKAKMIGTWTQFLPGEGLLVTHIDEDVIQSTWEQGSNTVNSGTTSIHGINIIEADGGWNLWDGYDSDYGSDTDPFYAANNGSFTPSTNPPAELNDGTSAGIYITNISEVGDLMSFDYDED
jgi:M6 family metalloprotease-like protein